MKCFSLYRIFFTFIFIIFCSNPAFAIKIGLITQADYAHIGVSKTGIIMDGRTGNSIASLPGMKVCIIRSGSHGLTATFGGKSYNLGSNYIRIKPEDSGLVYAKKRWYRGSLIIFNTGNHITVANDVDLENYIQGVVPAEMPSKWNLEAHKAQAIAARSYAVSNLGKRAKYGYDLKDTPEDQAYGGASRETVKTNTAVQETRGLVLVYGNKVIPAYYHASSGGYTVNAGAIWYKDLPFVKSVPSFDGQIPKNGHGVGMSQHGANILANYGYNAYQILGYFYQNVRLYRLNREL